MERPLGQASPCTLRPAVEADVGWVADLHVTAIAEGFLAQLGPRFLRLLYRRVLRSPHGFLVVAEGTGPEGETVPAGFVAGSTDVGRLYREFLRHDGPAAVVRCAPRLARAAPRAWETLRYGTRPAGGGPGGGPAAPHAGAGEAELLAMAVDPGFRRRGVGAALVQAFFQRAASAGSPSARVVVGASNAAAVTLYRHGGFTDQHELEVHRGVRSLVLRTAPGRPTP